VVVVVAKRGRRGQGEGPSRAFGKSSSRNLCYSQRRRDDDLPPLRGAVSA